jgi:hypothetical protein
VRRTWETGSGTGRKKATSPAGTIVPVLSSRRRKGDVMRAILGGTLALVCCCALLADDKKDEKIDAKKLVGRWTAKESKDDPKKVIELTKDGKAVHTTVGTDGKERKVGGT